MGRSRAAWLRRAVTDSQTEKTPLFCHPVGPDGREGAYFLRAVLPRGRGGGFPPGGTGYSAALGGGLSHQKMLISPQVILEILGTMGYDMRW